MHIIRILAALLALGAAAALPVVAQTTPQPTVTMAPPPMATNPPMPVPPQPLTTP